MPVWLRGCRLRQFGLCRSLGKWAESAEQAIAPATRPKFFGGFPGEESGQLILTAASAAASSRVADGHGRRP
jgi:hypothetical protein